MGRHNGPCFSCGLADPGEGNVLQQTSPTRKDHAAAAASTRSACPLSASTALVFKADGALSRGQRRLVIRRAQSLSFVRVHGNESRPSVDGDIVDNDGG